MTRCEFRRHVGAAALLVAALAACSGGDGTDIDAQGGDALDSSVAPTSAPSTTTASDSEVGSGAGPASSGTGEGQASEPAAVTALAEPSSTAVPVSAVPETGVPGLDSGDAFCAAWSRFGGSFQVIAVNAAFGAGSIEDRALIEVAAGPTVVAAHAEMADNWPEELASEESIALDEFFGPLARRLASASDALDSAGATSEQLEALDDAWVAFLAERDPTDAEVTLVLDDELNDVVVAAVPLYLDAVGPWSEDKSLITDASTPLTDEFLAARCPDQGTLAGQEVG